jgi:hypothetical protein
MIRKNALLFLFVAFVGALFGQKVTSDLRKINENYAVNKSFKIDMTISLFDNTTITETTKYSYMQENKSTCFKMSDYSTVSFDDFSLIIDDRMKYVFLTTVSSSSVTVVYDTLVEASSSHKFEVIDTGELNMYTFFFKDNIYEKIEILFNPQSFYIIGLNLYYTKVDENLKVLKFVYDIPLPLSVEDKNKVKKQTYISFESNAIKLSSNYKGYELIDYRQFKSN